MVVKSLKRMAGYADLARCAIKLRKSDQEHVQRRVRRHLIERMGKMRGLPQKLGQMLSFSDDNEEAGEAFAQLQQGADPLPLKTLLPQVEEAWGCPIEQVLVEIDPHGYAASLGQVHRAKTVDGQEVAVKIQYPGIHDAVVTDLKMLGWLSVPVGNLKQGFDLTAYRQVILEDIERELDYCQEAEAQKEFVRWAAEDPFLIVPEVLENLSTENILVTQWQDGDSWETVKQSWSAEEKNDLARQFVKWFIDSLFLRGMIHADLHPGNLRFRRAGGRVQMVLYDFGCVYRPSDQNRLALLRLIRATAQRDESPWPLFLALGFNAEFLQPLEQKLPALCHVLFEPFCAKYPFDAADWRLAERVSDVLEDDRWNFRIAGPADMILLMRAFHGLNYYLKRLGASVFWSRIIQSVFAKLEDEMNQLQLPASNTRNADFSTLAKYLKIKVLENGRTKVELTAYASGIDDLEELIDEDLQKKIKQQGILLSDIITDVRRRGYAPGPVFQWTEDAKTVDVWLE